MPSGLRRFQQSGQSHFVTPGCYRRQSKLSSPDAYDLFVQCLEDMRCRFARCIYGYVVMPEHVHRLALPHSSQRTVQKDGPSAPPAVLTPLA